MKWKKNLGAKSFACCEYQMRNLSILGSGRLVGGDGWTGQEKEGRKPRLVEWPKQSALLMHQRLTLVVKSDPSILFLSSGSGSESGSGLFILICEVRNGKSWGWSTIWQPCRCITHLFFSLDSVRLNPLVSCRWVYSAAESQLASCCKS